MLKLIRRHRRGLGRADEMRDRVDVDAHRAPSQELGLDERGARPHERVRDERPRLGMSLDEPRRDLGDELGRVGVIAVRDVARVARAQLRERPSRVRFARAEDLLDCVGVQMLPGLARDFGGRFRHVCMLRAEPGRFKQPNKNPAGRGGSASCGVTVMASGC